MTRRKGSGRTSEPPKAGPPPSDRYPSLRQRNPVAYWIAIIGVVSMVLGLVASAVGALL